MTYNAPELRLIGAARDLVLGLSTLPDLGCIVEDDPKQGDFYNQGEAW